MHAVIRFVGAASALLLLPPCRAQECSQGVKRPPRYFTLACERWCADSCALINGDVVRECGNCDSDWPCHPGAPGFPEPPHSDVLQRARKARKDQRLCRDIRLSPLRPTLVFILGPSNAGKTTLVRQMRDAQPVHDWGARSLSSCAWLHSPDASAALLGHWQGFTPTSVRVNEQRCVAPCSVATRGATSSYETKRYLTSCARTAAVPCWDRSPRTGLDSWCQMAARW